MDFNNCTNTTNTSFSIQEYITKVQDEFNIAMIPTVIYLCLLIVLGIIGNSLVLYIYSQKLRRNATKYLLMVIAGFNLLGAVIVIPADLVVVFQYWTMTNKLVCKGKEYITSFTNLAGAMTLLALAVSNYRKVCHPFGWQIVVRDAKVISIVTTVLSAVGSVPPFIYFGRTSTPTRECYKIIGYMCYVDDYFKDAMFPPVFGGIYLLIYIVCVVSLVVMYSLIGMTAHKHSTNYLKKHYEDHNINCKMYTLPESSLDGEQMNLEGFSNLKKLNISQYLQIPAQLLANPDIRCGAVEDRYLNNLTENDSKCESSVNRGTTWLQISSQNIKLVDFLEDSNSKGKSEDVNKTRVEIFVKSAQNMGLSWIRKSKCSILSMNFNENKSGESGFEERTSTSGTGVDEKPQTVIYLNSRLEDVRTAKLVTIKSESDSGEISHHSKTTTDAEQLSDYRTMNRTVIILVLISMIYTFSYLTTVVLALWRTTSPKDYSELGSIWLAMYHLFYRLYFINIAANPIIYNFCDRSFRRECRKLLCYD